MRGYILIILVLSIISCSESGKSTLGGPENFDPSSEGLELSSKLRKAEIYLSSMRKHLESVQFSREKIENGFDFRVFLNSLSLINNKLNSWPRKNHRVYKYSREFEFELDLNNAKTSNLIVNLYGEYKSIFRVYIVGQTYYYHLMKKVDQSWLSYFYIIADSKGLDIEEEKFYQEVYQKTCILGICESLSRPYEQIKPPVLVNFIYRPLKFLNRDPLLNLREFYERF